MGWWVLRFHVNTRFAYARSPILSSGIWLYSETIEPEALGRKLSVDIEGKGRVVAGGGIEPPTQGFSVLCSTN